MCFQQQHASLADLTRRLEQKYNPRPAGDPIHQGHRGRARVRLWLPVYSDALASSASAAEQLMLVPECDMPQFLSSVLLPSTQHYVVVELLRALPFCVISLSMVFSSKNFTS